MAKKNEPTKQLCDWVCSTRYEDIPEDARAAGLRVFIEEIGCMVAGATVDTVKPVVDLVKKLAERAPELRGVEIVSISTYGEMPLGASHLNRGSANGSAAGGNTLFKDGRVEWFSIVPGNMWFYHGGAVDPNPKSDAFWRWVRTTRTARSL